MSATLDETAKLQDYSSRAIPTQEQKQKYVDQIAQSAKEYIQSAHNNSGIMMGKNSLTIQGTTAWTTIAAPSTGTTYTDPTSIKLAVAEGEIKSLKDEVNKLKEMSNQLFDMISKITTDKQDELERIREIIKA